MELNTIRDAFDRVAKKQKLSSSKTQEVIEQIHGEIEQALERLKSGNVPALQPFFNELNTKLMEIGLLGQLEDPQKQLNLVMNKYVKLLEKIFNPDISMGCRKVEFDTNTINQIIASHFYRLGLFDIGDCFISEAEEQDAASMKSSFLEMYQILSAMRMKNLEPALNWATINRDKLREIGSDIELKLHRLQFVEILKKGKDSRDEALKYSRNFLAPLASNHLAEIQKLMGCLLWIGRLDCSPYPELLSTSHRDELIEELTRQFCNLLGQSYESPLSVTVAAGVQGLPPLLKLMNVMAGKKQEWESMKQLPVPLDLDREFQFHSIFVCPVSRDQATEENPPMLMSCGHVLCMQSIMKMSKNSTKTFKCPYCPSDIEASYCRQLYF